MSQTYRSRLSQLEKEITEPGESKMIAFFKFYYMYILVVIIWLLLLTLVTPSFLYIKIKNKKLKKRSWIKIICTWIVISAISCYAIYFFKK